MKNFDLKVQERYNYCLMSVLQAILKKYSVNLNQDEIASSLSKGKNNGFYADDEKMVDFMKDNGFDYQHFNSYNTPFNEPDTLLEEMDKNEGIILLNSHYYLLADFRDPNLRLINPDSNRIIEKNIHNLISEMRSTNGLFGLIKRIS